jgi:hypothetical protein
MGTWGLAEKITDEHQDKAYVDLEMEFRNIRSTISNPDSTTADINSAIRDTFELGMMSGSQFTLQRVIDRLGDETFLKVM